MGLCKKKKKEKEKIESSFGHFACIFLDDPWFQLISSQLMSSSTELQASLSDGNGLIKTTWIPLILRQMIIEPKSH